MFEKQVSYSKIVALIRKEINEVRMNPISLSGYLNSKKSRFDQSDPLMFYPLKKVKQLCVKTKQGIKGIDELDRYLLKQSACQQLKWSYELHHIAHKKAARLVKSQTQLSTEDAVQQILEMAKQPRPLSPFYPSHIQFQKQNINSNQTDLKQGVECILDDEYYIVYYGIIDPKQLVSTLLIDDGFPNRCKTLLKKEHRRALLNKRMNHIGIGIHQHPSLCFLVVIILANHVNQIIKQRTQENSNCECLLI